MKSKMQRMRLGLLLLVISPSLTACIVPAVVEKPPSEPTEAERSICRELARSFPTWAFDGDPETVANRVDTEASVEEGLTFTGVFRAVCPGALPD